MAGAIQAQQHSGVAGAGTAAQLAACSRKSHTSRIHSRVPRLQTTLGTIRTGGRWERGRSSRLVRLQYYFGTDKSDRGLATTRANSPQWDIFQSPLSRVSHLTWRKMLSCFHSNLWYWALEFGPGRNTREHRRRECPVAPRVQHLAHGKQILCLASKGPTASGNPAAGYPQTTWVCCFLHRQVACRSGRGGWKAKESGL